MKRSIFLALTMIALSINAKAEFRPMLLRGNNVGMIRMEIVTTVDGKTRTSNFTSCSKGNADLSDLNCHVTSVVKDTPTEAITDVSCDANDGDPAYSSRVIQRLLKPGVIESVTSSPHGTLKLTMTVLGPC